MICRSSPSPSRSTDRSLAWYGVYYSHYYVLKIGLLNKLALRWACCFPCLRPLAVSVVATTTSPFLSCPAAFSHADVSFTPMTPGSTPILALCFSIEPIQPPTVFAMIMIVHFYCSCSSSCFIVLFVVVKYLPLLCHFSCLFSYNCAVWAPF